MSEERIRVLLVDDDDDDYLLVRGLLDNYEPPSYRTDWASTYEEGLVEVTCRSHDVYLIDYRLGERTGLQLLEESSASGCEAPFILLTGQGDYSVDVMGMKSGAADFLRKSELTGPLLERSIRYAIERKRVEAELRSAKADLERTVEELNASYWHLKKIQEVLPICMRCEKVKTGDATWENVVAYLKKNSLFLSHSYCPQCAAGVTTRLVRGE